MKSRFLDEIVLDNPVLQKDLLAAARAPSTWIAAAVGALGLFGLAAAMHGGAEPSAEQLAQWTTFRASGTPMFLAVTGVVLVLQGLLLPALASSSIAAERERGTMPLLLLSALSPSRIVLGKWLSLLLATVPFFAVAAPLLFLASTYGGPEPLEALAFLALLAVHAASLAAVGVGASSLVHRARFAAPLAMALGLGPNVVLGFPLLARLVVCGADVPSADVDRFVVLGVIASALMGAAALLLARDQLSPRTAPRWRLRRLVDAGFLVAMPALTTLTILVVSHPRGLRLDESALLLQLEAAAFMVLVIGVGVAIADRRPVDGLTPRRQALVLSGMGALGVALARLLPAPAEVRMSWSVSPHLETVPWLGVFVFALYGLFGASLVAAVARRFAHPAVRIGVAAVILGVTFLAPLVLHELRWLFQTSEWALGFMNPALVVARLVDHDATTSDAIESALFFLSSSIVLLAVAGGRRTAEKPAPQR
jgi:ABC-type transport system involved in multi-copper enzyme maturation permease subunit